MPNVLVQNKLELEKATFPYEPELKLFFHEPKPCQTGPNLAGEKMICTMDRAQPSVFTRWDDHHAGQAAAVLKGGLSDFRNRKYSFCNICPPFTWSKLHL